MTHALLWEYSYKVLKLAQLLGQLGIFLTFAFGGARESAAGRSPRVSHLGVDVKAMVTPPRIIIWYGESLMEYTGWCQKDFNVEG